MEENLNMHIRHCDLCGTQDVVCDWGLSPIGYKEHSSGVTEVLREPRIASIDLCNVCFGNVEHFLQLVKLPYTLGA